jgi:glutaminase
MSKQALRTSLNNKNVNENLNLLDYKKMKSKKMDVEKKEILEAVSGRDIEELKRLLKKGVTVNCADYDGRTPLHIAASNNSIEIL